MQLGYTRAGRSRDVIGVNVVLKNTYALLSLTILFSAVIAFISMKMGLPYPGIIITLLGYFGLLYLISRFEDSSIGILMVFVLTGFMGYTLGPTLSYTLSAFSINGGLIIFTALGGTGVIFLGLSAYVLNSGKDFSFMGSFLMIGLLVVIVAAIVAAIFEIQALTLAISVMFILLMSGLILYETSRIIGGGEQNYISATTSLYVSIFNLFSSLLLLLSTLNGRN